MKIGKGFKMRNVCGVNVITASGLEHVDFNKVISLNESAAYLWESLQDRDFTVDTVTELLCEKYDVEADVASADAAKLVSTWKDAGLIDG